MAATTGFGGYLATWILVLINFFLVMTGLGLLAGGIWLFIDFLNVQDSFYLDRDLREPSVQSFLGYVLTISGLVISVPALFGCCGALLGRPCLLATYAVAVSCGLLVLVTGGLALIMYGKETDRALRDSLTSSMISGFVSNSSDAGLADPKIWERVFVNFKCCGVNNASDFDDLKAFMSAGSRIPHSCCIPQNIPDNHNASIDRKCPTEQNFLKTGCYDALLDETIGYRDVIGGSILAIASTEIILIISAAYLARKSNSHKSS